MNRASTIPSRSYRAAGPVLAWALVAVLVLQVAIGLLLAFRRLTGAFTHDLPPAQMLLAALVATAVAACTRIAWRSLPGRYARLDPSIGWGSSLALALFAIGCAFPAYRSSDWLIWLPLVVADQLWRQNFFDASQSTSGGARGASNPNEVSVATARLHRVSPAESVECEQLDYEDPIYEDPIHEDAIHEDAIHEDAVHEDVLQQLYRVRDQEGQEVIYGALRADFSAGQRTAVVHAAFCPPLAYLPEIEADALPGQATRIKVVQALSHGVRLDVRLASAAEEDCYVWIDMAARPTSPQPQMISA